MTDPSLTFGRRRLVAPSFAGLKLTHLAVVIAFMIGLLVRSPIGQSRCQFLRTLDLVHSMSNSRGDSPVVSPRSVAFTFVTFCFGDFYLFGSNLPDIVLSFAALFHVRTFIKTHNTTVIKTQPVVQEPPKSTVTEEMREEAREILSKAIVQTSPTTSEVQFDPKVEVGEQPINMQQTRRVVCEAIASLASTETIAPRTESGTVTVANSAEGTVMAILDLLIILDTTESMGDYIQSSKQNIMEICSVLLASGRLRSNDGLRIGVIAYRDYPEIDNEFVLTSHGFTDDLKAVAQFLNPLKPYGGGDRPEAFSTALDFAYNGMEGWRDDALKAVVVITDAAPHGIGEAKDDYPRGAPEGVRVRDPLQTAKDMAEAHYSIFVLACEPRLGQTSKYAIDFYKALSDRTLGRFCSLIDHRLLPAYIIGALLEKIDLRLLSSQYEEYIRKEILEEHLTVEQVVSKLHNELTSKKQRVTNMQIGEIYKDVPDAGENYKAFIESASLDDARPLLRSVATSRISDKDIKTLQKNTHDLDDFSIVSVYFHNQGNGRIALKTYDTSTNAMQSEEVVPDGQMIEKRFKINVPINFTVTLGRSTKNFCKTFVNTTTVNVDAYFT